MFVFVSSSESFLLCSSIHLSSRLSLPSMQCHSTSEDEFEEEEEDEDEDEVRSLLSFSHSLFSCSSLNRTVCASSCIGNSRSRRAATRTRLQSRGGSSEIERESTNASPVHFERRSISLPLRCGQTCLLSPLSLIFPSTLSDREPQRTLDSRLSHSFPSPHLHPLFELPSPLSFPAPSFLPHKLGQFFSSSRRAQSMHLQTPSCVRFNSFSSACRLFLFPFSCSLDHGGRPANQIKGHRGWILCFSSSCCTTSCRCPGLEAFGRSITRSFFWGGSLQPCAEKDAHAVLQVSVARTRS